MVIPFIIYEEQLNTLEWVLSQYNEEVMSKQIPKYEFKVIKAFEDDQAFIVEIGVEDGVSFNHIFELGAIWGIIDTQMECAKCSKEDLVFPSLPLGVNL
ncbi:MAG: hypothetical protein MUE81_13470 [Thermoflexibacter sp.]|jgi:hypothetical protein|nr:hypothetical protein [Thermoflexibacter sp.]